MLLGQTLSVSGLRFYRDPSDNCVVIPRKEAYEFFYPGKSSKDGNRLFPQFKPFHQIPGKYRNHPEAFITLHNLVDKFYSMARSKREPGNSLFYQLFVDMLSVEEKRTSSDPANQKSSLKDLWLKELAAGVCRSHVQGNGLEAPKLKRDNLINISKTEVVRIFGPHF